MYIQDGALETDYRNNFLFLTIEENEILNEIYLASRETFEDDMILILN